jgi:saccharolysin
VFRLTILSRHLSTQRTAMVTPPVAPLKWTITAEQIAERANATIAQSKLIDDEIGAESTPTFDSVIRKYTLNENHLINQQNTLAFYHHVSPDKELRDASTKVEELFEAYQIDAGTREDVYKAVKSVYDEYKAGKLILNGEDSRLVEKLETKFRRNGLALDKDTRDKVAELRKKLSNICIKFNKQLGDETGFQLFTKEQLQGVSDSTLEQFTVQDGKYKVTYKYPDYTPIMKYAKHQSTRQTMYLGFENRVVENSELVIEAVKLRAEIAKLLGYNNHAQFVLEERMAKSPETVGTFLNDLRTKATAKGYEEVAQLLKQKNEDLVSRGLAAQDELYAWDFNYYHTRYLEKEYQVEEEKIAEYFPLNQTIEGMLSIFERLFSLKFVSTQTEPVTVWHEDVHLFAVWRTDKDEFVGYLYLDMHPRDNKYGHAANFSLVKRFDDGQPHYPYTAIVCNFSKPTPTKPSLLKHSEVVTFFHELGHGIHDLVGKAHYARFSGTDVDWDFVEAPSQMLEYWTWNKEQLRDLSGHYTDSSKKLDDTLIDSLIRTKHVHGALLTLRQLYFGLFDYTLHTSADGIVDVAERWNTLKKEISLTGQGGMTSHGYSAYGHIMGGYDAGYYGYLWSQVFASDMYYTKFKKDPMNAVAGAEYRDKVIGRGGSGDQAQYLVDFLGRKPNNEAFLEELGIAS